MIISLVVPDRLLVFSFAKQVHWYDRPSIRVYRPTITILWVGKWQAIKNDLLDVLRKPGSQKIFASLEMGFGLTEHVQQLIRFGIAETFAQILDALKQPMERTFKIETGPSWEF